ncbi:Dicer-like protein 2 [Lachnellula arida]|uniref:Dicer-like protein 2 n=1 Tax=Lachnellula arida TaxID=1316785 RepID=A0A8T9BN47_9HELO|nr:Dicer-like protein 2 [Lachnellula arida]
MDVDDSDSEPSDGIPCPPEDELPVTVTANEIVEDLTGEADVCLNDEEALSSVGLGGGPPVLKPWSYQTEMLQESLRRNVIVAMDTGSGKTHVAVMRMLHELDHLPSHQMIWFLAPTVSLCFQQYEYIKKHIPSVQVKFLSGADNVDRWTDPQHWDVVLKNVKILVCTYQILLDALTHAFIKMDSLGLIVFDEISHNCVGNHAGSKIMKSFYHRRKAEGHNVPRILGLTASPVMRSDPKSVTQIEETLDAICRTPKYHRAELLKNNKRPVLSEVFFDKLEVGDLSEYTRTIASLGQAYDGLNIAEDPYVIGLIKEDTDRSRRKLEKVRLSRKTWCTSEMKRFHSTALKVCKELGAWAVDKYVSEVVTNFLKEFENSLGGIWDVPSAEKTYLAKALNQVHITRTSEYPEAMPLITNKARKLIDILLGEPPTFSGIVFVQERAVVFVLAHLLAVHPETRGRFRVGTMVGNSSHSYRPQSVAEFLSADSQTDTLSDFRSGKLNLVIATSVLEEGIDVPSCNVVICFQKPANLKSFVQRRGRARSRDSKLILLLESADTNSTPWEQIEKDMKTIYEDDMRQLRQYEVLEGSEEHDGRYFRVEKTGALLDLDNALSHLYHFCATLPRKEYVDLRPEFICTEVGGLVRATVILPLSVNENVRVASSQTSWSSEKNAIKDAAFEAYMALYKAGLVNDHMLPLLRRGVDVDDLLSSKVETRASLMTVKDQLNPWIGVAQVRKALGHLVPYELTIGELMIHMYLPLELPTMPPFQLFWDSQTEVTVKMVLRKSLTVGNYRKAQDETLLLLAASFGSRFPIEQKRHVVLFSTDGITPLETPIGRHKADGYNFDKQLSSIGLIRDVVDNNRKYLYQASLPTKPPIETIKSPYDGYENAPASAHLHLKPLTKKAHFLHKMPSDRDKPSSKPFSVVLPTSRCTVDDIPFAYVQFGLFIPSIMHRFESYFIAEKLSKSILKKVDISDLELIRTAIIASSANEGVSYQRLEFLGDSILKLCTSIQLIAAHPLYHEGYLSAKKDRLVANSRLSRGCLELGLDKFIITQQFKGLKWRPLYDEDLLATANQDGEREMSSKVLADVVEALVGAAMVNGGFPKALACLQVFLPEIQWKPLDTRRGELFQRAGDADLAESLKSLETLIGYQFNKKALLLEAITHASYNAGLQSYERFEFLGDSILDNIVVLAMYAQSPDLTHFQMHLLRTALVNADFLAFICMSWCIEQEASSLQQTGGNSSDSGPATFEEISTTVKFPLWRFLRHMSPTLSSVQTATSKHFAELQPEIKNAIEKGSHYPWALLAKLQAQKFYSDIIESLLGAVWIDSGSLDECTAIVERMGILKYLRRIVKDGVHVMHPKEELGILADSLEVKYKIRIDSVKRYVCEVFVGGERIVEYEGGVSKMEAQTKAAELAVAILGKRKDGVGVGGVALGCEGDAMVE